jgi:hypothetical protein
MFRDARSLEMAELVRRLLPALVCAIGLGWHGAANASSMISGFASGTAEHGQYCKCRHCQPESCCCGPRQSRASKPGVIDPSGRAQVGESCCVSDAPCGDQGLPGNSAPGCSAEAVLFVSHFRPVAVCRLLSRRARCILPTPRGSLVDEPPEFALDR